MSTLQYFFVSTKAKLRLFLEHNCFRVLAWCSRGKSKNQYMAKYGHIACMRKFLRKKTPEEILAAQYNVVNKSDLFDAEYYHRRYGVPEAQALRHYLERGWCMGFESAPWFSDKDYSDRALTRRRIALCKAPLAYYVSEDCFNGPYVFSHNRHIPDAKAIRNYWNARRERVPTPAGVVYTCLTGHYDTLISPFFVHHDWDYICFTDNKKLLEKKKSGVWTIRKTLCYGDPIRINRYHKWQPHILFPEYNLSIYIDANINILSSFIYDEAKNLADRGDAFLRAPIHFRHNPSCIYDEFNWAIQVKKERVAILRKQLAILKEAGMPERYGLTENNILLRKHWDPRILAIDDECWGTIKTLARRDQLIFVYILWKRGIAVSDIAFPNARRNLRHFAMYPHLKKK